MTANEIGIKHKLTDGEVRLLSYYETIDSFDGDGHTSTFEITMKALGWSFEKLAKNIKLLSQKDLLFIKENYLLSENAKTIYRKETSCQGCQYKPAPNHNYPEVCISCSRFYGDMYTK